MAGPKEPGAIVCKAAWLLAALEAGLAPTKVLALMLDWGLLDPVLLRPAPASRTRTPRRRRC